MKGATVAKELNPEIQSTLANIQSLCQQIMTMESAEATAGGSQLPGAAEPSDEEIIKAYRSQKAAEAGRTETAPQGVTTPEKSTDETEKITAELRRAMADPKVAKIMKDIVAGNPDASTASDTAETRIGDQSPENLSAVSEVEKALTGLAAKLGVKKSADPIMGALDSIAKSLTIVAQQQNQQGLVIGELLEGLGVAKAATAPQVQQVSGQQVQKSMSAGSPVISGQGDISVMDLAKALIDANSVKKDATHPANYDRGAAVRKELGDVATLLGKQGVWNQA